MIRRLLPFLIGALGGCTTHGVQVDGHFALDAHATAGQAPAAAAAAAHSVEASTALTDPVGAQSVMPVKIGSSGGAPAAPAPLRGTVADQAGRPLANAVLEGAGMPVTSGADGGFAIPAGAAPLLTASLPGYIPQTMGLPYRFAMAPAAPADQPTYTITGRTTPAVASALVVFGDADGAEARGLTGPDGTFSLQVTPRSNPPAMGLLVVAQGLEWPGSLRYRVAQVAPLAGAIAVGAQRAGLSVALQPVPGRIGLQAPAVPAGLRPGHTELAFVGADGAYAAVAWSDGPWPADLPAPQLPGVRTCVSVSAQAAGSLTISTAEHLVAPGEAPWAPTLLAPPDPTMDASGHVRWSSDVSRAALALYRGAELLPTWEGLVSGQDYRFPNGTGAATELEVQVWDAAEVPWPSRPRAPQGDRRHASKRLALPATN